MSGPFGSERVLFLKVLPGGLVPRPTLATPDFGTQTRNLHFSLSGSPSSIGSRAKTKCVAPTSGHYLRRLSVGETSNTIHPKD
jgi:hypothetical protein